MKLKLLVVDSSAAMRRVIRSVLAELALEIQECPSGADAMPMYKLLQPDFAVLALDISGVDGIALSKRIKDDHPEARIILAADYDDPTLRAAAMAAGVCGYVLKENLFTLPALLLGL